MRRREFITLLGSAILVRPIPARAQQQIERMRRVAVFMGIPDNSEGQVRVAAFRQALQVLGWSEGRNIQFDYRWSVADAMQARQSARELVDLRPDVILANSTVVALAVKDTTRTTSTVFVQVTDPVGAGVVETLARPGGNVTGFMNFWPTMAGKWLELLKNVAPNITRVAYLFNPKTAPLLLAKSVESAAPLLSLQSVAGAVDSPADVERLIEQFARDPNTGLLVVPDPSMARNHQLITALAAHHRLPAVYPFRYFVASGGLMSYGSNMLEGYRQAASYVDRILRGERPSELPVQAPTKFELIINRKTAKELGITIPPTLLNLADEVIE